jgi:hypothetical protein
MRVLNAIGTGSYTYDGTMLTYILQFVVVSIHVKLSMLAIGIAVQGIEGR